MNRDREISSNTTVKITQGATAHQYHHIDLGTMQNQTRDWKLLVSGRPSK